MADQAFTIPEFLQTFKVGRTLAYDEFKSGRLTTYKIGRARRIGLRAAEQWQRSLEAETSAKSSPGSEGAA